MDCVVDFDSHHSLAIISDLFFALPLAIWVCVMVVWITLRQFKA
jgi:hypothetical protein